MDDKTNDQEQDHQATTDRSRDAHLLMSFSEAPSRMENFNTTSTPTSGRKALAVNSPSELVTADDPEPNGSTKFHPTQKRNRRGDYVLIETSEGAELGKDLCNKDEDDMEGGVSCAQTFWYGHGWHT
eukprot:5545737-Pleurochrysis_carterae.AAC.1